MVDGLGTPEPAGSSETDGGVVALFVIGACSSRLYHNLGKNKD